MEPAIIVYGVENCEDTQRTREHLSYLKVPYRYVDLEREPDAERQVKEWNSGKRITPTLELHTPTGTRRLAEPSNADLNRELDQMGLFSGGLGGGAEPNLRDAS